MFHYLSIYDVPLDKKEHFGSYWTLDIERLGVPGVENSHTVQLVSKAKEPKDEIRIESKVETSAVGATVLYVSVKLGSSPVLNTRVTCNIRFLGEESSVQTAELVDNGAGDPDINKGDGIYSKYLINNVTKAYTIDIFVKSDDESRAFTTDHTSIHQSKYLGTFQRIFKDNLQVAASNTVSHSASKAPSRILDLTAKLSSSKIVNLTWTAPGEYLDEGRAELYLLFQSADPTIFTSTEGWGAALLYTFPVQRTAGQLDTHLVNVTVFNQHLYMAMQALDKEGNKGGLSNIGTVFVPFSHEANTEQPITEELQDYQLRHVELDIITARYVIPGIAGAGCLVLMMALFTLVFIRRKSSFHSSTCIKHVGVSSDVDQKDTIYEGFSIDEFDTRKIEQIDYYNSLRKNLLDNNGNKDIAQEELLVESVIPRRGKDCSEEEQEYLEDAECLLGYSIHIYDHSPRKYKGPPKTGTMTTIFTPSPSFIHSTHV